MGIERGTSAWKCEEGEFSVRRRGFLDEEHTFEPLKVSDSESSKRAYRGSSSMLGLPSLSRGRRKRRSASC